MANQKLTMEEFNRICTECGLTPDVKRNEQCFGEASYFTYTHPISDTPIEFACYEEFSEDDNIYISVGVPSQFNMALGDYPSERISTDFPFIAEARIRSCIENQKRFLDAELEARNKTTIPFNKFIDFMAKKYPFWRNVTVELSCPFKEFMNKIEGATVQFNAGDVSATFKEST